MSVLKFWKLKSTRTSLAIVQVCMAVKTLPSRLVSFKLGRQPLDYHTVGWLFEGNFFQYQTGELIYGTRTHTLRLQYEPPSQLLVFWINYSCRRG